MELLKRGSVLHKREYWMKRVCQISYRFYSKKPFQAAANNGKGLFRKCFQAFFKGLYCIKNENIFKRSQYFTQPIPERIRAPYIGIAIEKNRRW